MNNPRRFDALRYALVMIAAFGVFGVIAWSIQQPENNLKDLDDYFALSVHDFAIDNSSLRPVMLGITNLCSLTGLIVIGAVVALGILWFRRFDLAMIWVVVIGAGAYFNRPIKEYFRRERPIFAEDATFSFPSGHSMRAMILFGFLAYLLCIVLPKRWQRFLVVLFLAALVVAIGYSRIFLGKHFFTDVVGGFMCGAGWVAAWICGIEVIRAKKLRSDTVIAATPASDAPAKA